MRGWLKDSFKIARNIFMKFPSSFSSMPFGSVYEMYPYSSIDTSSAWKRSRFILSGRSDCIDYRGLTSLNGEIYSIQGENDHGNNVNKNKKIIFPN